MTQPPIPLFTVDAFTSTPFTGNPAAVCILTQAMPEQQMQAIAAELNLSETAFVLPLGPAFSLRWFTPLAEVDLCGHATLATAHILWQTGTLLPSKPAQFATRSGTLIATQLEDSSIQLDFPIDIPTPIDTPPNLAEALGCPITQTFQCTDDLLVLIDSPQNLRNLTPDFVAIAKLPIRGLIVTSESDDPQYDFLSRFFGPAVGINEDPATGSAQTRLAPYWSARLNKTTLQTYQASPRGGHFKLTLPSDQPDRLHIAGHAVTITQGQLIAPQI